MRVQGIRVAHVVEAAAKHAMPFRRSLRGLRRRFRPVGEERGKTGYCIQNGLEQIAALREAGFEMEGRVALEFGTGWLPLIPWLLHLAGAREVVLTDIDRLMDAETMENARRLVGERLDDAARVLGRPRAALEARLATPMAYRYLVPWDAAAHPSGSVDLVLSRATFEHVPLAQLCHFFAEFHRILAPGGMMTHVIDNSDHWQHRDPSLSRLNFLQIDGRSLFWRLAQFNPQGFQNRLRHDDYIRLMEAHGFRVAVARGEPDPRSLADLPGLPLQPEFRAKAPRDLAVLISLFVAVRVERARA